MEMSFEGGSKYHSYSSYNSKSGEFTKTEYFNRNIVEIVGRCMSLRRRE
jgi:hypothetical protein